MTTNPLPDLKLHGGRVLACVDGSSFSEVCVPYAVSLAQAFHSAVTLVHVMQPHHDHAGPQTSDALGWEISRQEAATYLERLTARAAQALGRPVDARLEQGHPAERIVDLARELGAEITVLGSHGEAGVTPWSLGSTVQQVLAVTRSSVLVARSSSAAEKVVALKRILVPLDGLLRAESVLPPAARIASAHGAEILLVHVVAEPLPTSLLQAPEDVALAHELAKRTEAGARNYLEHLQAQLAHETTSVRTLVVRHASQHQGLLELSQREHADLIVLSAHGSACDSARSFGGVTAYLLTHGIAPLLVLQDLPELETRRAADDNEPLAQPSPRANYAPESL